MTAKVSEVKKREIVQLFKEGNSDQEIARKAGVSRQTAAKYTEALDEGLAIKDAPAARLTSEEVAFVQQFSMAEFLALRDVIVKLARAHVVVDCPKCVAAITILRSQSRYVCRRHPHDTFDWRSEPGDEVVTGARCDWRAELAVLTGHGQARIGSS